MLWAGIVAGPFKSLRNLCPIWALNGVSRLCYSYSYWANRMCLFSDCSCWWLLFTYSRYKSNSLSLSLCLASISSFRLSMYSSNTLSPSGAVSLYAPLSNCFSHPINSACPFSLGAIVTTLTRSDWSTLGGAGPLFLISKHWFFHLMNICCLFILRYSSYPRKPTLACFQ